jgi:hypothetical protein
VTRNGSVFVRFRAYFGARYEGLELATSLYKETLYFGDENATYRIAALNLALRLIY